MWKIISTYIHKHRKEIDLDEPRADLWMDIEEQLRPPAKKHWLSRAPYLKAAAMVFITAGLSYVSFGPRTVLVQEVELAPLPSETEEVLMSEIEELPTLEEEPNDELEELETYYLMQLAKKQENLDQYNLNNYRFAKQYIQELEVIDRAFKELKEELTQEGLYEYRIEAVVQTYELKIKILEQLLHQIQKSKTNDKTQQSQERI